MSQLFPTPRQATGFRRYLYLGLGFFFVGLGYVGIVTPGIPATPFLLLALWLFSRSSQRFSDWLLRSRIFGGFLRDWQQHGGVRMKVKVVALTLLPMVLVSSIYFGNLNLVLSLLLLAIGTIGAIVVLRLPTVPPIVEKTSAESAKVP